MEQYSTSLYKGNVKNTDKQMVNAKLKVQHRLAETVGYKVRMDVGVRRRMLKCIEEQHVTLVQGKLDWTLGGQIASFNL
jgi:hypothetical protein